MLKQNYPPEVLTKKPSFDRIDTTMYRIIRIKGLMIHGRAVILEQLSALAEPTRSRLMLILEQRELTVSELCGVLQMPQSTVSRHLKALAESKFITSRISTA